jgi:GDP-4-dehydro-6-deoxy-D-mannose reductase
VRVLITGANGFVGVHLAAALRRSHPAAHLRALVWGDENLDELAVTYPGLEIVEADLRQRESAREAAAFEPDLVFHLAAAASVSASWHRPELAFEVNLLGTLHLLTELRAAGTAPRVVVATSGEIYGRSAGSARCTEDHALAPMSPYAVSKAAQDLLVAQEHASGGLPTVRLRLFNHTGPGRPAQFAESSFARQIAAAELGLAPGLVEVGNLDAVRDFTDVRDVTRAYLLAASHGEPGAAYNVCSGRGVTIAEILRRLCELSRVPIEVVTDPKRLRPADVPSLIGDPTALETLTGWRAEIPLEKTLGDLLDHWRRRLAADSDALRP